MQGSTTRPKKGKKRDPRVSTHKYEVPLAHSHATITSAAASSSGTTTRTIPLPETRPVKRPRVDAQSTPVEYTPSTIVEDIPESSTTQEPSPDSDKRSTQPQGASAYMKGFQEHFSKFLDYMLIAESHPTLGQLCRCGVENAIRTCHCNECFHFEPCCVHCFITAHQASPLHWAEVWNGAFFERQDISTLGHVITLGHDVHGGRCPQVNYTTSIVDFILVDETGVHNTKLAFCKCAAVSQDRMDQLLNARIFPATVNRPTMGFTFNLLRNFHLQTLSSKKSPYDYIYAVRCRTNNAFPHSVPDPYSQFLRVQRVWRALMMLKRSGQVHGIDKFFPSRKPGNVVVPCFGCPEPGFNVPDHQWDEVDDEFRHLNLFMLMEDGHFGLQRFAKVDDPDDVSLLGGAGLFPEDDEYKKYVRDIVATSTEKSTCSSFNAIEMQNKLKFKGCVITGVVAVECGRHVVFQSMVDLQKGERYANADFALAHALRRYFISRSLAGAIFFRWILLTYDVACQYYINLRARFEANFQDLADIIDIIHLLVPKMHLDGHKDDCKYRFSLNYFKGAGRSHGEGIEASWAESKQSGGSTRQMNHGHRHDTLNDFHNYWNWNKVRGMAVYLGEHLLHARTTRQSMIEHYLDLTTARGQEAVTKWEMEPTEAKFVDGEWQSVYRLKVEPLPSQTAIYQSLEANEKLRPTMKAGRTLSSLRAHFIDSGMRLQQKQHDLKRQITKGEILPTDINARRKALSTEIGRWRKTQIRVLPQIEAHLANMDEHVEIEAEVLFLPSDIPLDDHDLYGLGDLVDIERCLREGEANDAVTNICNTVMHSMLLLESKRRNAQGVYQNLRSLKHINNTKGKRDVWAAQYRRARKSLLHLTGKETLESFPPLQAEDMQAKNAAGARNLGDGSLTDSWIWTYGKLKAMNGDEREGFIHETKKVQWFRARADMDRWIEEVEILEEEFRRLIRACEKMDEVWVQLASEKPTSYHLQRADVNDSTSGYRVYATQKAAMYRQMALDARKRFLDMGGSWPSEGETLCEHIKRRRPAMEVDWELVLAADNT